jgi:antibiotic biosynthesis monooxygenase (ABM) superfamily enzyme
LGRSPSAPRPWVVKLATTILAWLAAFLAVLALLSLLGHQLGSLPLAPRALAISGVLVALVANVVMPVLGRVVPRVLGGAAESSAERNG